MIAPALLALSTSSLPLLTLSMMDGAFAATCETPEAISALRGDLAPRHPGMLHPPPQLDGRSRAAAEGRVIYGSPYEHHIETEHFSINWWEAGITEDQATRAGEALEGAWAAFIDEGGWTAPVSSDTYYLWVLLDPSLGGTGYTTLYYTDEFPAGYPVIYLNPAWASQVDFWGALSAHEFMHTIQYAMRAWDGSDPNEAWYWEASATWASELSDPDRDGFQYASAWYAEAADARYDTHDSTHEYGMFVFNAWLEQQKTGPGGMLSVWTASSTDSAAHWDTLLPLSTGSTLAELWGGFTGAYGNANLEEWSEYTPVTPVEDLVDGQAGELPMLGSHYYRATAAATVTAEGPVVLGGAVEQGSAVVVAAGERIAVTGLEDDAAYTLHLGAPEPEDSGTDSAQPEDSAQPDDSPITADDRTGPGADDEKAGCGCASGKRTLETSAPMALLASLLGLYPLRRRRGAQSPSLKAPPT